jgi:hypothetical protein
MHARGGSVFCPECCSQLADEGAMEIELGTAGHAV